jgi:hypothetical protein
LHLALNLIDLTFAFGLGVAGRFAGPFLAFAADPAWPNLSRDPCQPSRAPKPSFIAVRRTFGNGDVSSPGAQSDGCNVVRDKYSIPRPRIGFMLKI